MEIIRRTHTHAHVGLVEYVKCSTDYQIQFVNKHEHNKPEKVSQIHLVRNFQKQVQIEDSTQENETATNTVPLIARKTKEKFFVFFKNQQIYTNN